MQEPSVEDVKDATDEQLNTWIGFARDLDWEYHKGERRWGWDDAVEPEILGRRGTPNDHQLDDLWHDTPPCYASKWSAAGPLLEELAPSDPYFPEGDRKYGSAKTLKIQKRDGEVRYKISYPFTANSRMGREVKFVVEDTEPCRTISKAWLIAHLKGVLDV